MLTSTLLRLSKQQLLQCANYSTKLPQHLVAFMENQGMVVCWHPEPQIPYECTKPLPMETKQPSNTVLKIGEKEVTEQFKHMKSPLVVEKLAAMTYTTKHIWFPRSRDKRAKKTEMDRPYL